MKVTSTEIEGVKIIEPDVFGDARGWFCETYNDQRYRDAGIDNVFVQDNESFSSKGVVRGLHWQAAPHTQAKLVRVIQGAAWDVVVDIRKGSPTTSCIACSFPTTAMGSFRAAIRRASTS